MSVTIIAYLLLFKEIFPTYWEVQFQSGTSPIAWWTTAFHISNGGFEFFFHRYILHAKFFRWSKKFYEDHTYHHRVTNIFPKKPAGETSRSVVEVVNHYPITQPKQYKSSFFPYWGLAGFAVFFNVVEFIPLQLLMPNQPILIGGFLAIALSYVLYELLHALEHMRYSTFWKKWIEHPQIGYFAKKFYGFHLFHHGNILCNMGISGVLGWPLFDWLFGTYKQPERLLLDGTLAREEDFSAPTPCWLIRVLDRIIFGDKNIKSSG